MWSVHDEVWEAGFAVLLQFVTREGHARVHPRHVEGGFRLGGWVGSQRARHKDGRMTPEQAQRLEALPRWTWDPMADQ